VCHELTGRLVWPEARRRPGLGEPGHGGAHRPAVAAGPEWLATRRWSRWEGVGRLGGCPDRFSIPSSRPAGGAGQDHLTCGCAVRAASSTSRAATASQGSTEAVHPPDGAGEAGVERAPVASLRRHGDGDAAAVDAAPPALRDGAPRGSLRLGRPPAVSRAV
jgi:hypothetical protein